MFGDEEDDFRAKHFEITVAAMRPSECYYPDEVRVSMTQNGFQYWSWSLNEREAKLLVERLDNHFKWGLKWKQGK